jgi:hypothetical protein
MRPPLQLILLLFLISPNGAAAQQSPSRVAGPVSIPLIISPHARWAVGQPLALDSIPPDIRPTHWKEGALIGGLSMGLGLALLADGLCQNSDSGGSCGGAMTAGFLLGGVIGGIIGALIGGQFPKAPDS